jgi:uncharacterized protein
MKKNILITGGNGLIGKPLTEKLLSQGHAVSHLSRKKKDIPGVKVYEWNVDDGTIDEKCLEGIDTIIHLAGEGIAEKPWTRKRKHDLVESRTASIRLIYDLARRLNKRIGQVISASGVGYYGDRESEELPETSRAGDDFMGKCCVEWENAADEGESLGATVVKLRTGVVLARAGGALATMEKPVKLGLGSPLGSGKQWMPWIHVDDMVAIYLYFLDRPELEGAYNAAAPETVTNADFTRQLAQALHRPFLPIGVPEVLLRILLGEMKAVILNSTKTSQSKLLQSGYTFSYPELPAALRSIYES